jgi:hypothetical protein
MSLKTVKIFQYLDDLDCFVVSDAYRGIADQRRDACRNRASTK